MPPRATAVDRVRRRTIDAVPDDRKGNPSKSEARGRGLALA